MRLDKFLWSVRLFKTRTLATDACREEKVLISGQPAKAAYEIKTQDIINIKNGSLRYSYTVIDFPTSRVSAKLVQQFIKEITSPEEKEKNESILANKKENHALGIMGRPTKQHRRKLDKWKDQHFGFND